MLTYNVDTNDGLTNGTFGKIYSFEKDTTGTLTKIYVCGTNSRHCHCE